MSRLRTLAAVSAALVVTLLSAGCASDARPAGSGAVRTVSSGVDVDTPRLRQLKAAAGVAPCRRPAARPAVAGALPDVVLPCLGGGPGVNLSRLRGPLVVNLFAQWCGPCRTELPFYQELHRKGGGVVTVLGVDYLDTQPSAALELVRRSGVTFPLLADPDGLLRRDLRVRGLPGVVFVDASGRVADVEFRVMRSYAELRGLVQRRLDVRVPR